MLQLPGEQLLEAGSCGWDVAHVLRRGGDDGVDVHILCAERVFDE